MTLTWPAKTCSLCGMFVPANHIHFCASREPAATGFDRCPFVSDYGDQCRRERHTDMTHEFPPRWIAEESGTHGAFDYSLAAGDPPIRHSAALNQLQDAKARIAELERQLAAERSQGKTATELFVMVSNSYLAAADAVLRHLCGLQLGDQPVAVQREHLRITREFMERVAASKAQAKK